MKKNSLMSLLALVVCAACSSSGTVEREPNDTLAVATPAVPGQSVRGELASPSDRDAILLRAAGNKLISFELSHDHESDLAIDVYLGNRHVKTIDAWAASSLREGRKPVAKKTGPVVETAAYIGTGGQDCILVVHAAGRQGKWPVTWTMTTGIRESDGTVESEPNDDITRAMPLVEGRTVEGRYAPLYDARAPSGIERDLYSWVNQSTNRVILEVDVSGVPDVNPVIDILDDRGRVTRSLDAQGIHLGEQSGPLGLVASATCHFAVRNVVPGSGNSRISYTVFVKSREVGPHEEFESNNSRQSANPLVPGGECQAAIHPVEDQDWFILPVAEGGKKTLSLRVSPEEGLDPVLEVLDQEGRLLLTRDDAGPGKPEYVPNYGFETRAGGELHIRVRSKKSGSSGKYTLAASLYPVGPFAEFEPNGTAGQANLISLGVDIRGFLHPAGDSDWLEFDVPEAGALQFRLAAPAGVPVSMVCTDKAGRELGRLAPGSGDLGLKVAIPSKGRYRVAISSDGAGNPRDPWVLAVTLANSVKKRE
ncbi:MAG TPA: hypothetical protein PK297_09955 [Spirochaetota bacterium]|nr:hypothetical protein [Spirochaetota bacterium]